jgi:hypothetical protein
MLLKQLNILYHSANRNGSAVVWVVLMTVDAEELDGLAVDKELTIFDFNFPKTNPAAFDLDGLAFGIL